MKNIETCEVFYCDCCETKIGISPTRKFLDGAIMSGGEVEFEPIVFGDYCEECIVFAQEDFNKNGQKGFVSDRYDINTEKVLEIEKNGMKLMRQNSKRNED